MCQWSHNLTLSVAPTFTPVSTADARAQCRVDINDDDTLLERKIRAAAAKLESVLDRQFCQATWLAKASSFPVYSDTNPFASLFLPRPPLASVTSIVYLDANGSSQTFSASDYTVETPTRGQGAVHLDYGVIWPSVISHPNAVTVTFVAGYASQAAVPDAIKEAILALVDHQYWNRGEEDKPIPDFITNMAYAESWGSEL